MRYIAIRNYAVYAHSVLVRICVNMCIFILKIAKKTVGMKCKCVENVGEFRADNFLLPSHLCKRQTQYKKLELIKKIYNST